MVNPAEWDSDAFQQAHGQHWGRTYTPEAVDINWHVPTAAEIRCAVRIVNRYYALSKAVLEAYLTGTRGRGLGLGIGRDRLQKFVGGV